MIIPATLKVSFKNAEEIKRNEVYPEHYMINGNIVKIGTLLMKVIEKANKSNQLITVSTTIFDHGYVYIKKLNDGISNRFCPLIFIPYDVVADYGYVESSMAIIDKLEIPNEAILEGCSTKTSKNWFVNSYCN